MKFLLSIFFFTLMLLNINVTTYAQNRKIETITIINNSNINISPYFCNTKNDKSEIGAPIIKSKEKLILTYDSFYKPPVSSGYIVIQPSLTYLNSDTNLINNGINDDQICTNNPIKKFDNLSDKSELVFDCECASKPIQEISYTTQKINIYPLNLQFNTKITNRLQEFDFCVDGVRLYFGNNFKPGIHTLTKIENNTNSTCSTLPIKKFDFNLSNDTSYAVKPIIKTNIIQKLVNSSSYVSSNNLKAGFCVNGKIVEQQTSNLNAGDIISSIDYKNLDKICSIAPDLNVLIDNTSRAFEINYELVNIELIDITNNINYGAFNNKLSNTLNSTDPICVNNKIIKPIDNNKISISIAPDVELSISDVSPNQNCTNDDSLITKLKILDGQFVTIDSIIRKPVLTEIKPHNCIFKNLDLNKITIPNIIDNNYSKLTRTGGYSIANFTLLFILFAFIFSINKIKSTK